jgi:hypothetical protein
MQSVYSASHISAIASKPPKSRSYLEVSKLAAELSRVHVLSALDVPALRQLAEQVRLQVHLPGSVLMRQGDVGDRMFLLTEGSVNVMKVPEEELSIIRTLGTWPDTVEPLLKDSPQVLFQTTLQYSNSDILLPFCERAFAGCFQLFGVPSTQAKSMIEAGRGSCTKKR